jgi:hypothetical protein
MEEVRHNLNINLKLKENKIYPKYSDNDISMIDFDKDLPKVIPEYNKLSVDDFLILKLIGKGAYGKSFFSSEKRLGRGVRNENFKEKRNDQKRASNTCKD